MNIVRINEIRASLGLAPVVANPVKAAKAKRTDKNRQARGDASRALKAARQGRGK